jgi:endogenous inhibitor of DNA gyrase (YacG/DUF329 family)
MALYKRMADICSLFLTCQNKINKMSTFLERTGYPTYEQYMQQFTFNCLYCGKEIIYNSKDRKVKYCSEECCEKQIYINDKNKKKMIRKTHDKCVVCGKTIEQSELGKLKKYCSNKCKKMVYNKKNKI